MSAEQKGSNMEKPERKRQKRGDEEEAAEIIAFGGPMYDEATARKMLKAVVLVTADNAEDGEAVIGFDPDDAALDNVYFVSDGNFHRNGISPMMYFAEKGDAKMCRYLISRGASTTLSSEQDDPYLPMYAAADRGHLDVCKVLYAKGAKDDVRRGNGRGWTPFHIAAINDRDQVLRWLTLHGALCQDGNSEEIEGDRIYPTTTHVWIVHRTQMSTSCKRLVVWAKEATQTHSSLVAFLHGALPPAPDQDQSRTLQCLSGHPGVRKHIGDFVGLEVTKRKQLRILRNVVHVLPSFIRT